MIVVVSDTHLGTDHLESVDPDREAFTAFLRYLRTELRPSHLVLNGDIEDLWRRDMRTLTREDYDVFQLLRELRADGIEVHYVLGNHDWYARKDVALHGDGSGEAGRYYDTDYAERLRLRTGGTTYAFRHGHQFDPVQDEWYFDKLAVISTDSIGARFSRKWALLSEVEGRLGWLRALGKLAADRVSRGSWDRMVGEMDRCGHDHDLGIDPGGAGGFVADHPDVDWLCLGHTHRAGIDPETRLANSGAWLDERNTYLVLEERPRLLRWNDGDPEPIEVAGAAE